MDFLQVFKKGMFLFGCIVLFFSISINSVHGQEKIGVIYILHGGMDNYQEQYLWDAAVHQFTYDPNHPVSQIVIWNSANWTLVLQSEFAIKFIRKFEFEYERIGGTDPFHAISDQQLADMKAVLDANPYGLTFEVDFANWMSGDRPEHYPYPRFLYYPPSGTGDNVTYCGEDEPGGPWSGCVPDRYDVDGPVERLLKKGVSRIIMVDMTVGGVRFYKSFDVVQMTKRALDDWNTANGTSIPLIWVNDYSTLMERSYPSDPAGWTPIQGPPTTDQHVLLNGSPNPIADDSELALLHVEGIEAGMPGTVSDADTGVILFNHGLFDPDRKFFDPKIDDSVTVNENIKAQLLSRHPEMASDNIIGAYGGVKEINPENGLLERTRPMRGENLAHSYLHEGDNDMPGAEWGYRYWDALEYLKNRGVEHIVIAFPQVVSDSVLTLVEFYNQIGNSIGIKTWSKWGTWDFVNYPGVGHPFADYWGNWVDTDCGGEECCFEMGGCSDGRPYPPPRQAPIDKARDDMDPSLAYDLSDYGHLGYDPAVGPPDPNNPVQNQFTGTWELYLPPSEDPRVGQLLAKHVLNAAINPLVYITNGEVEGITEGEGVTFEAHVTGGGVPGYTYQWSIKEDGDSSWSSVGTNSANWTWNPASGEAGIYAVSCMVTDSQDHTGEGVWDGFGVSAADSDNDGIPDFEDNCPETPNPNQTNSDNDSHGDVCDNCPLVDNEDQIDSNGNGIGDSCDTGGEAIPTLSEWGIIIFMTLILGISVIMLYRRRKI